MKCICQMCGCGKHRCPHFIPPRKTTVTSKEPCKVLTEYKGEFQKTNGEPIVLHRPDDCIESEGRIEFDTSYNNTYSPHKIETSPRKKKVEIYEKSMEKMHCDTEYGQNYLKGTADVHSQASYLKKKTQPYGSGDGAVKTSVTRRDFDAKIMGEKPQLKKLRDSHVPSNAPFETKSVQRADYTKFNEPPSKTGRRPDNISSRGQPAYYDTTTGSHYIPYEHKQGFQPKTPREVYEPNNQPFDGNSVMRSDYGVHKDPVKSTAVRHDSFLFATDEPMQKNTTNLAAYPNWGVSRGSSSVKEVATYRPPSKDMELQKTSDDYKNFGQPKPSKSLRPKTNITFGGDFDGVSMYTNKFVKHDVSPRAKPIVSREPTYYSSGVPFEGCSESKEHYKKHQTAPAKMVRRINELFEKNVAFEGNTSYKEQYASKKLPVCPILDNIKTNFTGYNVVDDVENGHRFLEKINDTNSNGASSVKVSPLPPIGESNANLVAVN